MRLLQRQKVIVALTILLIMISLANLAVDGKMYTSDNRENSATDVYKNVPSHSGTHRTTTNEKQNSFKLLASSQSETSIPFDITTFTNTSYTIEVNKTVKMNVYGAVTVELTIFIENKEGKDFNTFDIYLSKNESQQLRYFSVSYLNSSIENFTKSTPTFTRTEMNNYTKYTINFLTLTQNNNVTLKITEGFPTGTLLKIDPPGAKLEGFPYLTNMSLYPWLSIPMTYFKFRLEGIGMAMKFDNDTISDEKTTFGSKFSTGSSLIEIENITKLDTIQRNELNATPFNYNLTKLKGLDFIPAFIPELEKNMTYFIDFRFYYDEYTWVQYDNYEQVIEIDPWGNTIFTDTITLRHIGAKKSTFDNTIGGPNVPTHSLFYPSADVEYIGGHDDLGNLSVELVHIESLNQSEIRIKPRIPIEYNKTYTFTVKYKIPNNKFILASKKIDWTNLFPLNDIKLNVSLIPGSIYNWTVKNLSVKIVLPPNSQYNIKEWQNSFNKTFQGWLTEPLKKSVKKGLWGIFNNRPMIVLHMNESYQWYQTEKVVLTFRVNAFAYYSEPIMYTSWIFFILGFIVLIRLLSFGITVSPQRVGREIEIPSDLIKQFVETYQEKLALRQQLNSLNEARARGQIKAKEFNIQQTRIIRKMRELTQKINSLGSQLATKGKQYQRAVKNLTDAEIRRDDIQESLKRLERRRKEKLIDKNAYFRTRNTYTKQLQSLDDQIDRILNELRSLLTK